MATRTLTLVPGPGLGGSGPARELLRASIDITTR